MCNCGRGKINSIIMRDRLVQPDCEAVQWMIQPPDVVSYVGTTGRVYKVRNRMELVTILKADRPAFEELGYISRKE